jgi:hypothetical protein
MKALRRVHLWIIQLIDPSVKTLRVSPERLDLAAQGSRGVQFTDGAYLVLNRRIEWDQSEETWYLLTGSDFAPGDRIVLMHGRNDRFAEEAVVTKKLGSFGPNDMIHRWAIAFPN